jgi:hypothetical protein
VAFKFTWYLIVQGGRLWYLPFSGGGKFKERLAVSKQERTNYVWRDLTSRN